MEQQEQQAEQGSDQDSRPDAQTSAYPGGGRQVEQEPARAQRLGDVPTQRPDSVLQSELDALLASADDFAPESVELLVADGVVVMMGSVPDYETKRRLGERCASVPGVRVVRDQLQVLGESPSQTSDGLRTEAPRADVRGADR